MIGQHCFEAECDLKSINCSGATLILLSPAPANDRNINPEVTGIVWLWAARSRCSTSIFDVLFRSWRVDVVSFLCYWLLCLLLAVRVPVFDGFCHGDCEIVDVGRRNLGNKRAINIESLEIRGSDRFNGRVVKLIWKVASSKSGIDC